MPITDTTMDDQRSFNLIRQGGKMREQGAYALYEKYAKQFGKRLIYQSDRKLNAADAEEIVQETFIKVVRKSESFKGDSSIKTWLFSIAINCMIDHFREKGRNPPEVILTEEDWISVEETVGAIDPPPTSDTLQDCVGRGLAEFAKRFSEAAYALSLVMEGYDTTYISAAIGRNAGATREYLSQCRKKSEKYLQNCREYLSAA